MTSTASWEALAGEMFEGQQMWGPIAMLGL